MVRRVAATTKAASVAWLESIELENVRCFRERQTVPFTTPAVILIDEVDLHLHPKWQRTLQQKLSHQFPNA